MPSGATRGGLTLSHAIRKVESSPGHRDGSMDAMAPTFRSHPPMIQTPNAARGRHWSLFTYLVVLVWSASPLHGLRSSMQHGPKEDEVFLTTLVWGASLNMAQRKRKVSPTLWGENEWVIMIMVIYIFDPWLSSILKEVSCCSSASSLLLSVQIVWTCRWTWILMSTYGHWEELCSDVDI